MSSAFIILQHLWKFYSQIYKMNCLVGFGVFTWNILSIWCQNYRMFHFQQPNLPNVLLCDLFFFWVTIPNYMRKKNLMNETEWLNTSVFVSMKWCSEPLHPICSSKIQSVDGTNYSSSLFFVTTNWNFIKQNTL